jgi:hypothetical protein
MGDEGADRMTIEHIAKIAHQANKAYCESIGDMSQKDWEDADLDTKSSKVTGVNFALINPDATPESQHQAWYKHKEADGWRYGPVKNVEDREHPCMLPYDMLPKDQRLKDALFQAVVKSLAPSLPYL